MPKLPRRLPYEALVLVALALGSCSGSGKRLWAHDEIEDIAGGIAADAINDSDKVRDLTARVEALESEMADAKTRLRM